jgi:hypothetical protein
VTRLRPLSEAECYTRLYGDRESTVTVLHEELRPPSRPSGGSLGEHLRRSFEERLDERPDELFDEADAA